MPALRLRRPPMSSKKGREEREDLIVGRHPDADVFLERSQEFLMRDEAENVLMLGLASGRPEDALLLTVERERQLVMAALQSGRNMIVSRGPASAVEALVDHLTADGISLPGVTGPVEAAGRFSDLWCARTGQGARLHMNMRVGQITEVVVPERPSGVFRQAAASDISLLAEWNEAFNVETRLEATRPGREVVTGPVGEGRLYVWEDGGPVSMAGWAGLTPGGVRIGYVYTPPKYRGRGYASACVADLSQLLLDRGRRFCALFTDLANPISNRIYARMGYKPVCDFAEYNFVEQDTPHNYREERRP